MSEGEKSKWLALLERHPEVAVALGWKMLAVGAQLVAGKIDDAIAQARAESQPYKQWRDLQAATTTLESAARDHNLGQELQQAALELAALVAGAAIRDLFDSQ